MNWKALAMTPSYREDDQSTRGCDARPSSRGPRPSPPLSTEIISETLIQTISRWALGIAYALDPRKSKAILRSIWNILRDILNGGTKVPSNARIFEHPDTFGGTVRGLSTETCIMAMRAGFFPWYHCPPIKWMTRKQRSIMDLRKCRAQKRTLRRMRSTDLRVTFDHAFDDVVRNCAGPRPYNWHALTWITPRLATLYAELHRQGFAHSFEVWNQHDQLVGGGFGVAIGRVFVGASMFSRATDASKIGCIALHHYLAERGFTHIDAIDRSPALGSMGYEMISREDYARLLEVNGTQLHDQRGLWSHTSDLNATAQWVRRLDNERMATSNDGPAPEALHSEN